MPDLDLSTTTIGDCLDAFEQVHLLCRGCGRWTAWRAPDLVHRPRALSLAALSRQAACTACGHVGAGVRVQPDPLAQRAADPSAWTPSRRRRRGGGEFEGG